MHNVLVYRDYSESASTHIRISSRGDILVIGLAFCNIFFVGLLTVIFFSTLLRSQSKIQISAVASFVSIVPTTAPNKIRVVGIWDERTHDPFAPPYGIRKLEKDLLLLMLSLALPVLHNSHQLLSTHTVSLCILVPWVKPVLICQYLIIIFA